MLILNSKDKKDYIKDLEDTIRLMARDISYVTEQSESDVVDEYINLIHYKNSNIFYAMTSQPEEQITTISGRLIREKKLSVEEMKKYIPTTL